MHQSFLKINVIDVCSQCMITCNAHVHTYKYKYKIGHFHQNLSTCWFICDTELNNGVAISKLIIILFYSKASNKKLTLIETGFCAYFLSVQYFTCTHELIRTSVIISICISSQRKGKKWNEMIEYLLKAKLVT